MSARATVGYVGLYIHFTAIGGIAVAIGVSCIAGGDRTSSSRTGCCGIGQTADMATGTAIVRIRVDIDFTAIGVIAVTIGETCIAER